MIRKVVLSKKAEYKLEKLLIYLVENWSEKVKRDFVKELDRSIAVIKVYPKGFTESKKEPGLRKCVVTKQTTLYFRFDSKKIYIVTIFDNRQDPKKLMNDL